MNYTLSNSKNKRQKGEMAQALKKIAPLLNNEKINLAIAILAAFIGAAASLLDPIIIGRAVDLYIKNGDYRGVLILAAILLGVYVIGLVATYIQTLALGGVGRRVLFRLAQRVILQAAGIAGGVFQPEQIRRPYFPYQQRYRQIKPIYQPRLDAIYAQFVYRGAPEFSCCR